MRPRLFWFAFHLLLCFSTGHPLCADEARPVVESAYVATATQSDNAAPRCDQIVLASTRNYPNLPGRTLSLDSFVGYRCRRDGSLTRDRVNLLCSSSFAETWIFVHGNQIPADVAVDRGTRVYRTLRCRSSTCRPIRFIIYSWPSERETCRLTDASIKRKRTNAESFYLGSLLGAIADQGPINVVAYSFGARIASGALHLMNGGCLDGYFLPKRNTPCTSIRVAMLAAAVENDGLLPGGRYDRAMCSTDRLLLLNNSRDQALRFFWVLDKSRPTALGRTGLEFSPRGCRVQQYDWQEAIGKDHSIWKYFDRPIVVDRILQTFSR